MLSPAVLSTATAVATAVDTSDPAYNISFGTACIYAVIGFAIVFFVLLVLNGFIRLLSVCVRAVEGGTKKAAPAAASAPAAPAPDAKPAIPAGMKAADGSLGDIKLYDVDDATAAMIMAIVADQLEAPLNELRFKSIREVKK
jgi:Na+-transporting methylmalonyl-CoA/oxaloacetate decarboxylase gamma subunit